MNEWERVRLVSYTLDNVSRSFVFVPRVFVPRFVFVPRSRVAFAFVIVFRSFVFVPRYRVAFAFAFVLLFRSRAALPCRIRIRICNLFRIRAALPCRILAELASLASGLASLA